MFVEWPTEADGKGHARGMTSQETRVNRWMAPVGKGILSRMFDVFGNVDGSRPRGSPTLGGDRFMGRRRRWRGARRRSEIFGTGIKIIDVVAAARARWERQVLFGGAGVGKTVLLTEMIHNMVEHGERASASSAASVSVVAKERILPRHESRGRVAEHGDGVRPDERAARQVVFASVMRR